MRATLALNGLTKSATYAKLLWQKWLYRGDIPKQLIVAPVETSLTSRDTCKKPQNPSVTKTYSVGSKHVEMSYKN